MQIIAEDKYESDIGTIVGEFDIHQKSNEWSKQQQQRKDLSQRLHKYCYIYVLRIIARD